MKYLKKYLKPKSLTWWTALAALCYGIYTLDVETILAGLGGIGIRGALPEE